MKNKKMRTLEITEHSFYETGYEDTEGVEEQKRVLGMNPRKTYKEAKREITEKNSEKN